MGGPEMAPHTPQPLVAPRRSRGAPRPPHARAAPAKPWHPSILRLLRHPDGRDVDELADAVLRELASVASALDPADAQARVRLHDPVHEDHADLDLRRHPPV